MREIRPAKPYFPSEDVNLIEKEVEKILFSGMSTLMRARINLEV